MHYFIEISCLPDEGVSSSFIMGRVFDQLHLSLVQLTTELGFNPVGLTFPEYSYGEEKKPPQIGTKIKLWSQDEAFLAQLKPKAALSRLADYVHIRSIAEVNRPNLKFSAFKRVQFDSSAERWQRRQLRRHGDSVEVVKRLARFKVQESDLPYLNVKSRSSDQRFRLFIAKQSLPPSVEAWRFGSYGLSATVALPDS